MFIITWKWITWFSFCAAVPSHSLSCISKRKICCGKKNNETVNEHFHILFYQDGGQFLIRAGDCVIIMFSFTEHKPATRQLYRRCWGQYWYKPRWARSAAWRGARRRKRGGGREEVEEGCVCVCVHTMWGPCVCVSIYRVGTVCVCIYRVGDRMCVYTPCGERVCVCVHTVGGHVLAWVLRVHSVLRTFS